MLTAVRRSFAPGQAMKSAQLHPFERDQPTHLTANPRWGHQRISPAVPKSERGRVTSDLTASASAHRGMRRTCNRVPSSSRVWRIEDGRPLSTRIALPPVGPGVAPSSSLSSPVCACRLKCGGNREAGSPGAWLSRQPPGRSSRPTGGLAIPRGFRTRAPRRQAPAAGARGWRAPRRSWERGVPRRSCYGEW
jgi:hypothetical protein